MSALFIVTLTHLACMLPGLVTHQHAARGAARGAATPHFAARSGPIVAFDDGHRKETLERSSARVTTEWQTTDNLSYKDVMVPEGDEAVMPMADQVVSIGFSASYITSGEIIESTGGRPLTLKLGDQEAEPLFQEAIAGMVVGGKRRVQLAPGSKYASPTAKETIVFEIELISIQTGVDALVFNLLRNRSSIINMAILLSFAPDILGFLGLLPAPSGADQLNNAFNTGGFGAVDILSSATLSAVASAPVVVDAANQWAAQGLQGLF